MRILIVLFISLFLSGCSMYDTQQDLEAINVSVEVVGPVNTEGVLKVVNIDHTSEIIDLKFNRKLDNLTLLKNTSLFDRVIQVNIPTVTPLLTNTICLKDFGGTAFYQGNIINIVSLGAGNYNLTLDTPLDFAFTVDDGCSLSDTNLAVDGSINPIIFSISPSGLNNNSMWHISRMICLFGGLGIGPSNEAPDDSDFLLTSAVTNGMVFRNVDGVVKNLFNAKTNGDIRTRMYDVEYIPKSKAGLYTIAFRRSFNGDDKNGAVIELKAESGDEFQIIVQDDLTEMTGGQCVVQGHVVEFE